MCMASTTDLPRQEQIFQMQNKNEKYKKELELHRRKACLRRQELARLNSLVETLLRGKKEEFILDTISHYQGLLALLHDGYKQLWKMNQRNIEVANDYRRQRDELMKMMPESSIATTDYINFQLGEQPEILFIDKLIKEEDNASND